MRNRIGVVVLLLATLTPASADIPNPNRNSSQPQPPRSDAPRMRIETDGSATEAKLIIPRSVLRDSRMEAGGGTTGSTSTGLLGGGSVGTQTIVAGIFLSLAFALGGVWLVRARKGTGKVPRAALGAVALMFLSAAGGIAYANIAPPRMSRPLNADALIQEAKRDGVAGKVRIEIVEEGEQIFLVLPKGK